MAKAIRQFTQSVKVDVSVPVICSKYSLTTFSIVSKARATSAALLLELECYASALPASFAADATEAERACRRLVAGRGASV